MLSTMVWTSHTHCTHRSVSWDLWWNQLWWWLEDNFASRTHLKRFIVLNSAEHLVAILSDAPGGHLHQRLLGVARLHGVEQLLHGVGVQGCCFRYQLDGDCHHITSDVVPGLQERINVHSSKTMLAGSCRPVYNQIQIRAHFKKKLNSIF